jgi:hypothetical protein
MNVTIKWWVGLPKELQKDIEFEEYEKIQENITSFNSFDK